MSMPAFQRHGQHVSTALPSAFVTHVTQAASGEETHWTTQAATPPMHEMPASTVH